MLDVGGGDGMNVIGMALTCPDSEFVSFDLSESAVRRGRAVIQALALRNVKLFAGDVTSVEVEEGGFDYLIAHGFYSWVPPAARDAVLTLARRSLGPAGIAFVSYNAQPGGHIRSIVRDLLSFALEGIADPRDRLAAARDKLQEVTDSYPEADPFQRALKARCRALLDIPGEVLLHDDLGEVFCPVYLTEFLDHAAAHGLGFLTEADPVRCMEGFAPEGADPCAFNVVAAARELDFRLMHGFRQTLLVHSEAVPDRRITPARLAGLYVSSAAQRVGEDSFRLRSAEFRVADDQITEALRQITSVFPLAVPLDDLIGDDERRLAFVRLYAADLVRLHVEPPPFRTDVSERPEASALARLQVARGEERIITLAHTVLPIDDPMSRAFIGLLDGRRTHAEIAAEMMQLSDRSAEAIRARTGEKLLELAQMPLLVA